MKDKILIMVVAFFLLASTVNAVDVKEELGSPGITPDSRFYFMNNFLDMFKSRERIADERAAAVAHMAEEGDEESLNEAMEAYETALDRRAEQANDSEDDAEAVAEQSSTHMEVMARIQNQVPEQARDAIGRALNNSAQKRERSLGALSEMNPERGQEVAERTMERVRENTPEEAQEGLQRALDNVLGRRRGIGDDDDFPGGADQARNGTEAPGGVEEVPEVPDNAGNQSGDSNSTQNDTGAPEQDDAPTGIPG